MKYILFIIFSFSAHICFSQIQRIDSIPREGIVLNKGWKFQAGDHPEWARPDFDDSKWQTIDPTLDVNKIPQIRQQPIGWLRIRFHVDSSLLNTPLAYHVFQSIASRIYLNGTLIQSYGVVSADRTKIQEWRPSNDPEGIVFSKPEQTLAIRISIQQTYLSYFIVSNYNCFIFRINRVNDAVHVSELQHQFPYGKAVLSVFFFTICLVHFILYIKMPSQKAYLYFGIQTFLNACTSFLSLLINFGDTSLTYINYAQPVITAMIMLNTFFLYCAIQELFTLQRNRMYWLILIMLVLSLPIGYLIKAPFHFYILIAIIVGIEPGRLVIVAYRRGNKNASILLTGYIVCWLATFFDILTLVNPGAGAENKFNLGDVLWLIAVISVPLSLMIYISIDFAGTSKELGQKLVQVNHLNQEVMRRTNELSSMRQTLASDFHDETGNMLSAITRQAALLKYRPEINADSLKIVENIIANSNQLYASSRHFIWNLNNDSDDARVLFDYLTSFGQVFYNQFEISFSAETSVADAESLRLEPFAAINLIFIFKEAMNNVVKHAQAKEVVLSMAYTDESLHFSLTDDGSWKEPDCNTAHHGLSIIEKRCLSNNFRFSVNHIKGTGTRVDVSAPAILKSAF